MEILRNLVGVDSNLPLYVRVKLWKLQQENEKGFTLLLDFLAGKVQELRKYSSQALNNSIFSTCFSVHLEFDCDIEKANEKCCNFLSLQKQSKAVSQEAEGSLTFAP